MNTELLNLVRSMKLNGSTDTEILETLSANYSNAEITLCLESLQYMKPRVDNDIQETVPLSKRKKLSKFTWPIIGATVFLILFAYPLVLEQSQNLKVNKLDKILIDKYDVDRSYTAGTTSRCVSRDPTNFGDLTGVKKCFKIYAKVYYPKTEMGTESVSAGLGKSYDREKLLYVDGSGNELEGSYLQFGRPIPSIYSEFVPFYAEKNLNLEPDDHVDFSGISSNKANTGSKQLFGGWGWQSTDSWLGKEGRVFQTKINDKILANESPASGAPTASEAMKQGRAPLVVFFSLRYCHSPSLVFVDKACVLPG